MESGTTQTLLQCISSVPPRLRPKCSPCKAVRLNTDATPAPRPPIVSIALWFSPLCHPSEAKASVIHQLWKSHNFSTSSEISEQWQFYSRDRLNQQCVMRRELRRWVLVFLSLSLDMGSDPSLCLTPFLLFPLSFSLSLSLSYALAKLFGFISVYTPNVPGYPGSAKKSPLPSCSA